MRWIFFIAVYLLMGWYSFQALKTLKLKPVFLIGIGIIWLLVLIHFIYQMQRGVSSGFDAKMMRAMSYLFIIMLFKVVVITVLFSEDIYRGVVLLYNKLFTLSTVDIPSRRRVVSLIALGIASLPFGALLYGMFKGKYNYKVLEYELEFDDLPEEFDDFKITHISDAHVGSFDDEKSVSYAIDLINKQESDVILFTGDLVNNTADEMDPWMEVFSRLNAKSGKYSVLGNHDYGDYVSWETQELKEKNLNRLKEIHKEIGFDLLLNENRYLSKNAAQIALVGVENWGSSFIKVGDLEKANQGISKDDFKILMSHDPSHWEQMVINHPFHYHLTLSGHTHGMQFGVEIPGWIKWSPVKWRYKYWAGIYKELGQFINVNRGLGFIGYSGRFGIWPEITVIKLKRTQNA